MQERAFESPARAPIYVPNTSTPYDADVRDLSLEEVAGCWHRPESFVWARIEAGKLPARTDETGTWVRWKDAIDYQIGVPPMSYSHPDLRIRRRAARAELEHLENMREIAVERVQKPWLYEVVYFIHGVGTDRIKIGKSASVLGRISGLKTSSPVPLRLVAIEPGYTELERDLHARFANIRSHGEWFRLTPELTEVIQQARRKTPLPKSTMVHPKREPWPTPALLGTAAAGLAGSWPVEGGAG